MKQKKKRSVWKKPIAKEIEMKNVNKKFNNPMDFRLHIICFHWKISVVSQSIKILKYIT